MTHQVHFLTTEADWIVILKDGHIERQGSPVDLIKAGVNIDQFCEETSEKDPQDEIESYLSRDRTSSRSSTQSMESKEDETDKDEKIKESQPLNVEKMSKGRFKGNVAVNYINSGASNFFVLSLLLLMFLLTQVIVSFSDYWVSTWNFFNISNFNKSYFPRLLTLQTRKN